MVEDPFSGLIKYSHIWTAEVGVRWKREAVSCVFRRMISPKISPIYQRFEHNLHYYHLHWQTPTNLERVRSVSEPFHNVSEPFHNSFISKGIHTQIHKHFHNIHTKPYPLHNPSSTGLRKKMDKVFFSPLRQP